MELNRHSLKALRERTGLSITELARRSDTSQSHLSNIEAGVRKASPKLVQALADALKVDVLAITNPVLVAALVAA